MFDQRAMEVLRYARNLNAPLVWNEPAVGGFGYRDAWNEGDGGWSASQHLPLTMVPCWSRLKMPALAESGHCSTTIHSFNMDRIG